MAWRSTERMEARNYTNGDERAAFRAGYSDGYHGYKQWASNEREFYPNAYSAGYWEGVDDGKDERK